MKLKPIQNLQPGGILGWITDLELTEHRIIYTVNEKVLSVPVEDLDYPCSGTF